jgi:arginase family enzyme
MDTRYSIINIETVNENDLNIYDLTKLVKPNYVITRELYTPYKNTLAIYDLLRQIMIDDKKTIINPIITLSPDSSISMATLGGVAEKFMFTETKHNKTLYKTNIHVLYIDSLPDLSNDTDFRSNVLSNILGLNINSCNRVTIPPENITLLGINEQLISDEHEHIITQKNITNFNLKIIKQKGIIKIMDKVISLLKHEHVHVVIDLSCMDLHSAPSAVRNADTKDGFDIEQIKVIAQYLKKLNNLHGIDITGYNFGTKEDENKHMVANTMTIKTIETIVTSVIDIKQKEIFNENDKFLIWRKINDVDPIGWYILRNIPLEQKEQLLNDIDDDEIIIVPVNEIDNNDDDNDTNTDDYAIVAVTTIAEQQTKCYYTTDIYTERCLYPGEKLNMFFEMINTPDIKVLTKENKESEESNLIQITIPEY